MNIQPTDGGDSSFSLAGADNFANECWPKTSLIVLLPLTKTRGRLLVPASSRVLVLVLLLISLRAVKSVFENLTSKPCPLNGGLPSTLAEGT